MDISGAIVHSLQEEAAQRIADLQEALEEFVTQIGLMDIKEHDKAWETILRAERAFRVSHIRLEMLAIQRLSSQ